MLLYFFVSTKIKNVSEKKVEATESHKLIGTNYLYVILVFQIQKELSYHLQKQLR